MESDTAPKLEALVSSALLIASVVVLSAPATSLTPCLAPLEICAALLRGAGSLRDERVRGVQQSAGGIGE